MLTEISQVKPIQLTRSFDINRMPCVEPLEGRSKLAENLLLQYLSPRKYNSHVSTKSVQFHGAMQ